MKNTLSKKRSPIAAALASPIFRKKVVPSKKTYDRKKGKVNGNND